LSPEETHYRLLKLLEARPDLSQRELAGALGISLGKVNYCLKTLVRRGWVEARRWRESPGKAGGAYFLTPGGLQEKVLATERFLEVKRQEYECLERQLEELQRELNAALQAGQAEADQPPFTSEQR
jgi:EPS-associated MarR family transcriptional regulator